MYKALAAKKTRKMAFIRSVIHFLWMGITVVPYALAILLGTLLGVRGLPRMPNSEPSMMAKV